MTRGVKQNWTDELAIAKLKEVAVNGMMPTMSQLGKLQLRSLWDYMKKNGGVPKFAEASGLELSKKAKGMLNAIDWTHELAIAKLREVSVNGMMPSAKQLKELQLGSLWDYMTKNGGVAKFAEAAGLELSKITKRQINANRYTWTDELAIAKIKELSVNGMMPSSTQLQELQLTSLWRYMTKNGGVPKFAAAAGLQMRDHSLAVMQYKNGVRMLRLPYDPSKKRLTAKEFKQAKAKLIEQIKQSNLTPKIA
jgi:hypothetical protein